MKVRLYYRHVLSAFQMLDRLLKGRNLSHLPPVVVAPRNGKLSVSAEANQIRLTVNIPVVEGDLSGEPLLIRPEQMQSVAEALQAIKAEVVTLLEKDGLQIQSGPFVAKLDEIREEQRHHQSDESLTNAVEVADANIEQLEDAFRFVDFFLGKQDRFYLYGDSDVLWVISTDSYRAGLVSIRGGGTLSASIGVEQALLIHAVMKDAKQFAKVTGRLPTVQLLDGNDFLLFRFCDDLIVLTTKKQNLTFKPEWSWLLREPEHWEARAVLDEKGASDIRNYLSRLSGDQVSLIVENQNLTLKAGISTIHAHAQVEWGENPGRRMEMLFNRKYLADAFRAFKHQPIRITFKNPISPICISSQRDDETRLHWLMPIISK